MTTPCDWNDRTPCPLPAALTIVERRPERPDRDGPPVVPLPTRHMCDDRAASVLDVLPPRWSFTAERLP